MRKAVVLVVLAAAATLVRCGSGGSGAAIAPFWMQSGVVVADFNGDGRADVAVTATHVAGPPPHAGYVDVYLSNATGSHDPPAQYQVAADPWGLAAGDFDGSGGLDLIAASPETEPPQINVTGDSGAIAVLRHDPNSPGSFQPAAIMRTGGIASAAAFAELTGDGRADAVVADAALVNGRALLLAQSATQPGTLLPPVAISVGSGLGASDVAVGDLDGDGRSDVVLAVGSALALLYQRSGAPFEVVSLSAGLRVQGVALADLDGDGRLDIVAASAGNAPAGGTGGASVTLLLQKAPGVFTPTGITVADGARRVAIGDLNGDGVVDVAAISMVYQAQLNTPSNVSVLLQSTQQRGVFAAPAVYAGPTNASFIAIGDIDGDSRNDLVTGTGPSVSLQSAVMPGTFGAFRPLR